MTTSFTAKKTAGKIDLTNSDGQKFVLDVSVLDMPLWRKYQEMERKAAAVKEKILKGKDSSGASAIDSLIDQMQLLCPDIEEKHLKGFDFKQCAEILASMVRIATGQQERTESQKKTTSGSVTTSSRLRGRARRSG